MVILQTVALTITFLIALGKFLDSEHIESATKDKIRSDLIYIYIKLYDAGPYYKKWISNKVDDIYDGSFESGPEVQKSKIRLYWLVGVPMISISFAYASMWVFKPSPLLWSRGAAWCIALLGGVMIGITGPLIIAFVTALAVSIATALALGDGASRIKLAIARMGYAVDRPIHDFR